MKEKSSRKRLDALLVERGLAESVQKAQAMILAGEVRIQGARADKAGAAVADTVQIEIASRSLKYVSRGGYKLAGALEDFAVEPAGMICVDIGSSTGGFTDCLLQNGATNVYAVDVNVDQLSWKLHKDNRVIRVLRNAREIKREDVSEPVDLVVADVSFVAVSRVLAPVASIAKSSATFLILVKPQFELPREDVDAGGIVTDPALHEKAINLVRKAAAAAGLEILGMHPSRLTGAEGNQEYFLHARKKPLE
ncbi:MAG TPA: TlyA family RNA methyltransferase [Candidatus Acidoferrum sp.]|jgi:23S rRNA (cytidine1920-2'-O)/16S rRNA (cytidine1409-2'-O)-methyltransferase